jgi:hypothetical protein
MFKILIPYIENGELKIEIFEYRNYCKFIRMMNILSMETSDKTHVKYIQMLKSNPLCKVKEDREAEYKDIKLDEIMTREVYD